MDDNLAAVRETLGLSEAQVRTLAANSIESSFLSPERKAALLVRL